MRMKIIYKRLLCIGLVFACLFATGCKKNEEVAESANEPIPEVLLITDYGTITDGSFNQAIWKGIDAFSKETEVVCAYSTPVDTDKESYIQAIENGVNKGAQIIICPGYMLEEPLYEAQKKYPNTKFVLIDGEPHNSDYSETGATENTIAIEFAEEQAGFLAGYSAVRDGYFNLGFIGGIAEDPVIRYGYGFVQGADYAAIEMGVVVKIRYTYANTFEDAALVETIASTWFEDDTEAIFACGGSIGRGVMKAAEKFDKKVIGVDSDQSNESPTVITSAIKGLDAAVYNALKDYKDGSFTGGYLKILDASAKGVGLPMNTSRFRRFDQDDYNRIYTRLADGKIEPYKGTDIGTTQELILVNTNVTYILSE